ncbi:MAG: DNA-binding protein WhiA [Clostridia bacterium]|nr:DNA-binding protein WhiA [Clostridia bacterium]
MQNFTEEIKNEITSSPLTESCCMKAALSAFIRTSGSVISRQGNFGFEIVTENEGTAEYISEMLESSFGLHLTVSGAKFDVLSGRDKLTFECVGSSAQDLLSDLGIISLSEDGAYLKFGIDEKLVEKDCCKAAYVKGAFLGGGSCTLPDEFVYSRTGYHFEIVFSNKIAASDFCELLCDFEILAKLVARKDSAVVYVKSKEVISDILNVISAYKCLEKLNKIVELKDKTNNENRVNNCSVSNIDKTVTASVKQVRAISVIADTIGLQSLDKLLFEVAEARIADKNASMQELAQRLKISKSCINHRMRKIFDIAGSLDKD